jgi:hypothetical protein
MPGQIDIRVRVSLPLRTRLGVKCLILLTRCRLMDAAWAFYIGEAWIRRTVRVETSW